ncbi:MAG: polysaccharide biosynthesis tyrosine autokinase [Flavobacteriales bacterium]|nr:polysaccharide biosynthesis tyrosine autokinase [Flavobacteriales bacterium]
MSNNFEEFESFDVRKIIRFLLKHWKVIAIGFVFSCFIGFLYIRYTTPEFRSTAKVLIKNDSDGKSITTSQLEGFGLFGESIGAESEAEILKSRQLIGVIVDELGLTTTAFNYGGLTKIKKSELIKKESPIWINLIDTSNVYFKPFSVEVDEVKGDAYSLKFENGQKMTVEDGDSIEYKGQNLVFETLPENKHVDPKFFEFHVRSRDEAITSLIETISIDRDQIMEGILGISMVGLSSTKNNDIINELIHQQQIIAIEQKNLTATKTNDFLTTRLELIEQKLDSIENIGRTLKSENGIIDVESELPALLTQERELEEELFELSFNEGIAEQMINFFKSNEDFQSLIPVSLSFKSSSLNMAISEYNQLVLERNRLLTSSNENNPEVVKRKNDIIRLRGNLNQSIQSYKSSITEQKKRVVSKLSSFTSKKSSIPKYELDYRDAMRDQTISESIYLLLLQKKEENEIILASTESNIRVIDYAYSSYLPVSPNKKLVYLLCGILGILIPILFFYIKGLLDNKLSGREEIEKLDLPVLGEIPLSNQPLLETFPSISRNTITEAFISVRTNIGFIINRKSSNVIMVTSSIAGEGKTFASLNLAKAMNASGRKTVVLGLDLRAPKLLEHINLPYTVGVSNYLSSDELSIEEITYTSDLVDGLDFIPCGTIPPNPTELLLRDGFSELMDTLRDKYDSIIIDTSPIGLVADTLTIAEHADLLVYVARVGYVKSEFMKLPQKLYRENKFKSLTVLLNGVERANAGYGYGYGFDQTNAKKGGILKWFRRKSK